MNVGEIRASLVATFDDHGFQRFDAALNGSRERAKQGVRANLEGNFEDRGFSRFTNALTGARSKAREAVKATLTGQTDDRAFRQFDQHVTGSREHAKQAIRAQLGGQFDDAAFARYQTAADRAQSRARNREVFKAHLGGDFDSRAFNAYDRQLNQTGQTHSRWTRGIEDNNRRASGSFGSLAKGVVAAGGAFAAFNLAKGAIQDTVSLSGSVAKLSAITGMDITTTSKWIEIFKVRGVETNKVAMGFITLSRNIRTAQDETTKHAQAVQQLGARQAQQIEILKQNGASHDQVAQAEKRNALQMDQLQTKSGRASQAFRELGVSQDIIKRGNPQQVLLAAADGLAKIHDPARRAALAQQLFGRQAQALIPILSKGSAGVNDALAAAQKYGAYLPNNIKTLNQARESQRQLNFAMDGIKIAFTQAVLPSLVDGAKHLLTFIQQMRSGKGAGGDFARGVKTAFDTVKAVVTTVVGAVGGLKNAMLLLLAGFAVVKIAAFAKAISGLFAIIEANPVGAFMATVGLLIGALVKLTGAQNANAISAQEMTDAWNSAHDAATQLRDANLEVIQAKLDHVKATEALTHAEDNVTASANKYGKSSPQWRQSMEDLAQARIDQTRATNRENDAVKNVTRTGDSYMQQIDEATNKDLAHINALKKQISQLQDADRAFGTSKDRAAKLKAAQDDLNRTEADLTRQQADLNTQVNQMPGEKRTTVDIVINAAIHATAQITQAASSAAVSAITGHQRGGLVAFRRGGILPGSGREDTRLVAAAPGEGFLTRHHMPIVDRAMRIAHAVGAPFRSLADMWSRVTAPHGSGAAPRLGFNRGGVVAHKAKAAGPTMPLPTWITSQPDKGLGEPGQPAPTKAPTTNTTTIGNMEGTISGKRRQITGFEHEYGSLNQLYSIHPADLVDPDTGALNKDAIKAREDQLSRLDTIRLQIFHAWQQVVKQTTLLVASYQNVLRKLNNSLKGIKGKNADKRKQPLRDEISKYSGKLTGAQGDLQQAGDDRDASWLDHLSLVNEYAGVAGTKPTTQTPDVVPPDVVPDVTPPDTPTPEPPPPVQLPPSPAEIAAAALAQFNTFLGSAATNFASFGSNLVAAGSNPFAGSLGQAAGARYFGGGLGDPGLQPAGTTIHIENHFQEGPQDAHVWAQQQRFQVDSAMG
jgi:hypothetical protein